MKIWQTDAARIRAVHIGSRVGPRFAAERVPTLAEALAVPKRRCRVVVGLKPYGHGVRLEEKVVESAVKRPTALDVFLAAVRRLPLRAARAGLLEHGAWRARDVAGTRRQRLRLAPELGRLPARPAALVDASGARVYPEAALLPSGPVSIGDLKAVNDRQLMMIERDDNGDDLTAPRFKTVFLLDLSPAAANDGYVGKTLLVASDNNFPFSNGRSRSRSADRRGPAALPRSREVGFNEALL